MSKIIQIAAISEGENSLSRLIGLDENGVCWIMSSPSPDRDSEWVFLNSSPEAE